MNRFRALFAVLALVAAVVVPTAAHAAGPQLSPVTIVSENFETAPVANIRALDGASTAWWGRITNFKHAGSYGLWCAGSTGNHATYPVNTGGIATWDLATLNDYYASDLSFWYVQPTLGAGDENGFVVRWDDSDPFHIVYQTHNGEGDFPLTSSWQVRAWSLSDHNNMRNLSRRAGTLDFQFTNSPAGAGGGAATGQGPTVDDLSVTAWKYGPVRNLTLTPDGAITHITWAAPWRSTDATSTEERPIAYRVYREIDGSDAWTELTTDKITGTSLDETNTLALDNTYRYAVQVLDQGFGTGYGQVILSSDSVTHAYVAPRYTLSYTPAAHGSLVGSATQVVIWGGSGSAVTAVPAAYYHFAGWSDGVQTATRTDTNVVADHSVTANFAFDTVTLSYTAPAYGSIVGSATQVIAAGGSGASVTASPTVGYKFVRWSDGLLTATRTDTNVTVDKSVTASFTITTCTVYASAGANGAIAPAGTQVVNYGGSCAYSINAAPGYHVADVHVDGVSVGSPSSYGFANIITNHTITATFAANPPNTFILSYGAGTGGSVDGSSTQIVDSGGSGTAVTATPLTGYHFTGWSDVNPNATRTDTNVLANLNVTANFARDTFTLTYNAGTHGSIVGSSTQTVGYGLSGTAVTATAAGGYHFVSWSDGYPTATRTDSNISSGMTVSASFAADANPPAFTITVPLAPVKSATPYYSTSEVGAQVSATLDGNPFVIGTFDSPGASVGTAGVHNLVVTMTTAGGITQHSAQFTIDLTPPVTTVTLTTAIITAPYLVILNATDSPSGVAAIYYKLDGATGYTGYPAGGVLVSTYGDHTIDYFSVDNAGNSETPKHGTFRMRQLTALTITKLTSTWTHAHTYTISGYLTPGLAGYKVVLKYQKPGSSHWYSVTITTTASGTNAKWSYRYKPAKKGTYHFKLTFAGSKFMNPSASSTLAVKVK